VFQRRGVLWLEECHFGGVEDKVIRRIGGGPRFEGEVVVCL
jgi:hypothetical protein